MRLILGSLVASLFLNASVAPATPVITVADTAVIDQPIMQGNLEPITKFVTESVGKRPLINLIINSPGGSVMDGFAFLNRLDYARSKGLVVRCFVPEIAASMAFQILLHCDQRYALRRAGLLWHRVSIQVRGASLNSLNTRDLLRELVAIDQLIVEELNEGLAIDPGLILFHLDKETMHTAPNLHKLAPGFFQEVPRTVEGLFEAMDSDKVVRQSSPFDFLKKLFGGEIFYIRKEFVIESLSSQEAK